MKQITSLLFILISISLYSQKGKYYQSGWHENSQDEFKIPAGSFSYSEKGKLSYTLSNDNDNIYLDIKIEDAGVQNRVLKEGLTIWIDMDSRPLKKMGVRFPIGSQRTSGHNRNINDLPKTNPDGSLATPLSQANTIELIGFTGEDSKRFPADNADSFRGFVNYDNTGVLYYSMVMPVAKLPVRNSKENDGAMPFTFGIEYGIVPEADGNRPPPSSTSNSKPGSGSRGRTGSGNRGGAMPGNISENRGGTGNTSEKQPNSPAVIFWVKNIKLAKNK